MPLVVEVGLGPGDIVLDGDPAPPKEGHSPHFSAHVYCGHTAGWIKMPLGTEGGLGPGHIVSDGDPAAPKGIQPPNFRPMSLWPYGRPSQPLLSTYFDLCRLTYRVEFSFGNAMQ